MERNASRTHIRFGASRLAARVVARWAGLLLVIANPCVAGAA
jgi:hypothetical protein